MFLFVLLEFFVWSNWSNTVVATAYTILFTDGHIVYEWEIFWWHTWQEILYNWEKTFSPYCTLSFLLFNTFVLSISETPLTKCSCTGAHSIFFIFLILSGKTFQVWIKKMVFTLLSFFGTGRAFMPWFVLGVRAQIWHFRVEFHVFHCLGRK